MNDVFDSLPAHLAARAKAVVAQREEAGLNVHFVNDRGDNDRFSFRSKERADGFREALESRGVTIL